MKKLFQVLAYLLALGLATTAQAQAWLNPDLTYDQQLEIIDARIAEITRIQSEYDEETANYTSLIQTANNQISILIGVRSDIASDLAQLQAELTDSQLNLNAANSYHASAESRASNARSTVTSIATDLSNMRQEITALNNEIDELYWYAWDLYLMADEIEFGNVDGQDNPELAEDIREEADYWWELAEYYEVYRDAVAESIPGKESLLASAIEELNSAISDSEVSQEMINEYTAVRDAIQGQISLVEADIRRIDADIQTERDTLLDCETNLQRAREGWASAEVDLIEIQEWLQAHHE